LEHQIFGAVAAKVLVPVAVLDLAAFTNEMGRRI